jgi:hypothetical protein
MASSDSWPALVPAGGNNGLLAGQMVDENPSAGSEGDAEPSLKRLPTDYRDQVPARRVAMAQLHVAPWFPRGCFHVSYNANKRKLLYIVYVL